MASISLASVVSPAGLASADPATDSREVALAQSPFLAALAAAMLGVPPRPQPPAAGIPTQLGEEGGAASQEDRSDRANAAALDGDAPVAALEAGSGGADAVDVGAGEGDAGEIGAGEVGTAATGAERPCSAGRGRTRAGDTTCEMDRASDAVSRDQATLALLQATYLTYASAPGAPEAQPDAGGVPGQPARGTAAPGLPTEEPGALAASVALPEGPQDTAVVQPEVGHREIAAEALSSGAALTAATAPWREDAMQRNDPNALARAARAATESESLADTGPSGRFHAPGTEHAVAPVSAAGTRDQRENSDRTGSERRDAMAAEVPTAALAHGGHTAVPNLTAETSGDASAEPTHAPRTVAEPPRPARMPMDRITLQLPDDAGGARIHVAVRAGSVAARIVTPDAMLGRRLEAGLSELQDALARQGFDDVTLAVPAPRAAGPAGAEAAAMLPAASTGAGEAGAARQHSSPDAERQPSREDGATPFGGRQHPGRQQQRSRRERER